MKINGQAVDHHYHHTAKIEVSLIESCIMECIRRCGSGLVISSLVFYKIVSEYQQRIDAFKANLTIRQHYILKQCSE